MDDIHLGLDECQQYKTSLHIWAASCPYQRSLIPMCSQGASAIVVKCTENFLFTNFWRHKFLATQILGDTKISRFTSKISNVLSGKKVSQSMYAMSIQY